MYRQADAFTNCYAMKPTTDDWWICGVPNKEMLNTRTLAWLKT